LAGWRGMLEISSLPSRGRGRFIRLIERDVHDGRIIGVRDLQNGKGGLTLVVCGI
jgi:hypothetical protein